MDDVERIGDDAPLRDDQDRQAAGLHVARPAGGGGEPSGVRHYEDDLKLV